MKESQQQQISRRRLLKALTAAGGVIAASLLPGKWAKPVVEVGVLPAHAQVTAETVYRLECASTPPDGPITNLTDFCFEELAAQLVLVSGVGPVAGVTVYLNPSDPNLFTWQIPFPWEAVTDDSGLAVFSSLCAYPEFSPDQTFSIEFSCEDPVNGGTLTGSCGPYTLDWVVD